MNLIFELMPIMDFSPKLIQILRGPAFKVDETRKYLTTNLFVTSKNETTNSPIQYSDLKCSIKPKEPFKTLFNGVLVQKLVFIYYFENILRHSNS